MKYSPLIFLSLLASLGILGSCCKPCNAKQYGQFPLRTGSDSWVGCSKKSSRLFIGPDSLAVSFTYSSPESGFRTGVASNCVDNGNCGLCCDQHAEGFAATQLTNGAQYSFVVEVAKDFIGHDYTGAADSIPDKVDLICSQVETQSIQLGKTLPNKTISIYGRTYSNTIQVGTPAQAGSPTTSAVSAFYFSKAEGIVGFVTGNGAWYALARN